MRERGEASFKDLANDARDIWNNIAEWWDERFGPQGNDFHRLLVSPATERLLELKKDESLLDIACGNGAFSRRAAALGSRVTAFDLSEKFIERARMHIEHGVGIVGQPETQYYFHRPLNVLLNTLFAVGFVLDGLEEPMYPEAAEAQSSRPRGAFSWRNFSEIPPVLVARLRLL